MLFPPLALSLLRATLSITDIVLQISRIPPGQTDHLLIVRKSAISCSAALPSTHAHYTAPHRASAGLRHNA